jgi:hypothetical protein
MATVKKHNSKANIKKAQNGYSPGMTRSGVGLVCPTCPQLRFGPNDGLTRKERKKENKEFKERDKEYNDPLRTWKYDKRAPINYKKNRITSPETSRALSTAKKGTKLKKRSSSPKKR